MKTIKKLSLIVAAALLLASCGTDPSKNIKGSGKIESIPFERIALEDTPEDVKATIEYKSREKATYVIPHNDDYYIVVSRGEQPTSGYEVDILAVEDWGDSVHVFYRFKDPADDELVSPKITYPLDIIKIPRVKKQILFKIVEHKNKRYKGIDINL
mgnify:CR=1 FL=1